MDHQIIVPEVIIDKLFSSAMTARKKAYSPYSKFMVGASVMTGNQKIYNGCNIENSSFGATICAERVAIFKAISEEGYTKIKYLMLVADTPIPCGICRQVLSNFCEDDMPIIATNGKGDIEIFQFRDILPMPFKNF